MHPLTANILLVLEESITVYAGDILFTGFLCCQTI